MKRIVAVLLAVLAMAIGCVDTTTGSTSENQLNQQPNQPNQPVVKTPAPKVDGKDVLVPDEVIQIIPGVTEGEAVYAACDANQWFSGDKVVSEKVKAETRLVKEGEWWRARGLVGKRFHPIRLDCNGTPIWSPLEMVYGLDDPWIDNSGGSPALLVK